MPTRPVTWDLDIPPENLLDPVKQTPPPGDPPNIDKLRALLMGTRFELLKISTFSVFLLSFVAIAVHGSHLTNPDNPFVADTSAAFENLAGTVSSQSASIRGRTEAIALAATHKAEVALGHRVPANSPVTVARAHTSIRVQPVVTARHHSHAVPAAGVQTAALAASQSRHARRHHEAVEVASAEVSNPQWSGSLLDLPNFVTAEGNKAGQVLLKAVEGGTVAKPKSATHKAVQAITTHRHTATMHASTASEWSAYVDGLMAPDSMIAAMAALLLYLIFVVILVQMTGGLRALADTQATV